MLLKWLNAGEATELGTTLADDFVAQTSTQESSARHKKAKPEAEGRRFHSAVQNVMQRVDREARPLQLNVFKRAKLANTFKWRLLEKGIGQQIADELTQALVMRLSASQPVPVLPDKSASAGRRESKNTLALLAAKADELLARGAYSEAANGYQELLNLDPDNFMARNNLGTVFYKQGLYREAEEQFRRAIAIKPAYADAQCNLGTVLRGRGFVAESETPLRRALKLQPTKLEFQIGLANTLVLLGRLRDAWELFEKVLRVAPRNVDALVIMGDLAGNEGRMAEAETLYQRALAISPKTAGAWAGLVRLRKMTPADGKWLRGAEETAASGLAPIDEITIRYALGKYYDDVGDFARAFRSFQRANELQKRTVAGYDREGRTRLVDDLIRAYSAEALAGQRPDASGSQRPVFVVGMMRSGTSLVEQIIASHPRAAGAGELQFWSDAMHRHEAELRCEVPGEPLRKKLATAYLRLLDKYSADALRVVDKATFNSDYLGLIHTVFPRARMIYLRRDPIDTCLSCYFQQFSSAHDFALDLSDMAHYYREHQRLVAHWRSALPPGTLLEVPYAELTADQEGWTRRIIDFVGLEWDERCLDFHKTERAVLTASFWQVRQKIYKTSVGRWQNYEKFIKPLLGLKDLEPLRS
jgi:tetratricopeptide (TPR) repeat protein